MNINILMRKVCVYRCLDFGFYYKVGISYVRVAFVKKQCLVKKVGFKKLDFGIHAGAFCR